MTRQHGKNAALTLQIVEIIWDRLNAGKFVVLYGRPVQAHSLYTLTAAEAIDLATVEVTHSRSWPLGLEELILDNGGLLQTASNHADLLGVPIDTLVRLEPVKYGAREVEAETELIDAFGLITLSPKGIM